MAKELSAAKATLLTIHYASEGNIKALHSFTPTRLDVLQPELILRILLTYLPESIEPAEYTTYVGEVSSRLYLDIEREDVDVDISPAKALDEEQAEKKVKKLKLMEIKPPSFPPHAPTDLLTRFLCQRAYRIDSETGLLNLVPQLIEPFLDRNDFIRTWYVSVILPLMRLEFEYYSADNTEPPSLTGFEKLEGKEGVDFLLQNVSAPKPGSKRSAEPAQRDAARDIKGLVGPWMYGHTERKRRKMGPQEGQYGRDDDTAELNNRMRKISLTGVGEEDKTGHDWEYVYSWMVVQAREDFPTIAETVEEWDGPGDVDLGGFDSRDARSYLDEDTQTKLESQYAQAVFATCYAVQTDTEETVRGAHGILVRLAALLDFVPPPDLATSVDSLPKTERQAAHLEASTTTADLEPDALLKPEHALTTPRFETYMLLQMMVYTSYQFIGLGYPISLVNAAKLHFYASPDEQLAMLKKLLHVLGKNGSRKDDAQWTADRAKLIWLWNWGIDSGDDTATNGAGVLGKINKTTFEEEMLSCFTETSCKWFLSLSTSESLSLSVEDLDPVQNVDSVGGTEPEELSWPFTASDQKAADETAN